MTMRQTIYKQTMANPWWLIFVNFFTELVFGRWYSSRSIKRARNWGFLGNLDFPVSESYIADIYMQTTINELVFGRWYSSHSIEKGLEPDILGNLNSPVFGSNILDQLNDNILQIFVCKQQAMNCFGGWYSSSYRRDLWQEILGN